MSNEERQARFTLVILSIFVDAQELEAFTQISALVKDILILVLTTQMVLIGTVLGFYFGTSSSKLD